MAPHQYSPDLDESPEGDRLIQALPPPPIDGGGGIAEADNPAGGCMERSKGEERNQ